MDQNTNEPADLAARPAVTAAVTRGVVRFLHDLGYASTLEFTLATGRRADVMALNRKGDLALVEIKSCTADFFADGKWEEYRDYCDAFYFAVASDFPADVLPPEEGLIVADSFGGDIVRPAIERKLAAARRKAVTLRFARQAATASTAPLLG